jgi:hypothetical protein
MTAFRREALLLPILRTFLHQHSYIYQAAELQFFDYRVDLYGYSAFLDATIAVELKLSKWQRAFEQALVYRLSADYVAIALPRRGVERVDRSLLRRFGIGLFSVGDDRQVEMALAPQRSESVRAHYREPFVHLLTSGSSPK